MSGVRLPASGTRGPGRNFVPVPANRLGLSEVRKPVFQHPPHGLKATWTGHASFLVETTAGRDSSRDVRILLDPVWSDRAGPYGVIGPVRFIPPPCTIDELPEVDAVCISHDHYDHLDADTLKKLMMKQKGNLRFFCPLGVKSVLLRLGVGIREEHVSEMDWWNGFSVLIDGVGSVHLICSPAQHCSGRAPWDFDSTLWCSWIVKAPTSDEKKLFFAGDTGYCHADWPATGPFDRSLLPIGCFKPRSILSGQHSSPEDSLSIHRDIRSKKSIGMHYGTFRGSLSASFEPVTEQADRWRKGAEAQGLEWEVEIGLCDIGGTVAV